MFIKRFFSDHSSISLETGWNTKALILSLGFLTILFLSWLLPITFPIWNSIDIAIFRFLNTPLASNQTLQVFWAMANHHRANFLDDIFLILLFWGFVRSLSSLHKRIFFSKMLVFFAIHIFCVAFISKSLITKSIQYHRASPTLVLENVTRLQQKVPYLKVKDGAHNSFPSDHGTTALAFSFLCFYFLTPKKRMIGISYFVFTSLPRLAVGAHWFSDIYVGSLVFLYGIYALFIYTPLLNLLSSALFQTLFSKPFIRRNLGVKLSIAEEIPKNSQAKPTNVHP